MQLIRLYASYEEACARAGAVDFAELLLRAYELWRDNPALLEHYRRRFRHVLVDEFQDTNGIQYEWLRLVAPGTPDAQGNASYPFVVGDDDQSVYRFRGARVANLQEFRRDYSGAQLFRLEQNYRSTANILAGANGLIAHNNSAPGQEPVDQRREGRADPPLHRLQRARRGGVRHAPHPRTRRPGRTAARSRHPVPLQRAVARVRGGVPLGTRALPGLRRPALLRAPGDQGRAGLPAPGRQPP